jgi:hypothetical protein
MTISRKPKEISVCDRFFQAGLAVFPRFAAHSHVVYGVERIRQLSASPFQRAYSVPGFSQKQKDVKTPFTHLIRSQPRRKQHGYLPFGKASQTRLEINP